VKAFLENETPFVLRHLGIAVPCIEEAIESYRKLFGFEIYSGPFDDVVQKVKVCFLKASHNDVAEIELVAPLTATSPVSALIARNGVIPYHLCLETSDLIGAISWAKKCGCVVISGPSPAIAFQGRRIAWICTESSQLIELLESAENFESIKREDQVQQIPMPADGK
jgi:methylmalonyl-CoA/ethylmalonyl-CoA epimerase